MKFWKSHETLLAAWIHLLFTRLVGYAPYWSSSTCKSRDCRRKEHVIRTCFIDLWLWNVILGLIQHVEQFTIQFALFSFDILDNQHGIIWGFCFALLFHVRIQPFLQTKEQQKTSWTLLSVSFSKFQIIVPAVIYFSNLLAKFLMIAEDDFLSYERPWRW